MGLQRLQAASIAATPLICVGTRLARLRFGATTDEPFQCITVPRDEPTSRFFFIWLIKGYICSSFHPLSFQRMLGSTTSDHRFSFCLWGARTCVLSGGRFVTSTHSNRNKPLLLLACRRRVGHLRSLRWNSSRPSQGTYTRHHIARNGGSLEGQLEHVVRTKTDTSIQLVTAAEATGSIYFERESFDSERYGP